MIPTAPTATTAQPPEPTHPCARCGAPVGPGVGLCERCNPLGLRDVSSTQAHGTIFVGVGLAIVALAFLARIGLSGVGPFTASVAGIGAAGDGLAVTITITNTGHSPGQTTCRVTAAGDRGVGAVAHVLSPQVEPGESITFTATVAELGSTPRDLAVDCPSP